MSATDDPLSMQGKTALVTGSGRNIGRAIALEFAARGANIVVNARSNADEAHAVANEVENLGVKAAVVMGDAGELNTVRAFKDEGERAFGGIDIYVSNAARRLSKDFFETTNEDWHRYLNQQLTASWYLAKELVPGMRGRGWGRVIHINGPDGWIGGWKRIPHSTAKGGLRTLTKSLAAGLGQYGITVNDVVPQFVGTVRDPETHPRMTTEFVDAWKAEIPIRRQVRPDEIAWACSFLCSTRSGGITGTALHVDGGDKRLG